jgi:hypothetical protein
MAMDSTVRRRCVFYFAGFDPTGPAHYHRLYKEQAAQQATLGGYQIEVGARRKKGEHLAGWEVSSTPLHGEDQSTTQTDYIFARWDDIVRSHWRPLDSVLAAWRFFCALLATQWYYLRTGALMQMLRLAWPAVVALVSPLLLVMVVSGLWLATPWLGWSLLRNATLFGPTLALATQVVALVAVWVMVTVALAWMVRKLEDKFHMLWLMRSYLFTRQQALGRVPALEERLQSLATSISQAHSSGSYDEVLVVGHSSGCIMAASALARSCMPPTLTQNATRLSFVTLGHWLPLLSSLPPAHAFRAQLQTLSQQHALSWVDFSAPADGCCFALVNAVDAAVPVDQRGPCAPKLLSPRFQTLFSPNDYLALRKKRFDLHFQYIMAGRIAGDYDYFALTAGNVSLKDRYAGTPSVTDFTQFQLFRPS